jgi:hypothetical protein
MTGNPSGILTLGLGSWGSAGLILTLGFGIGSAVNIGGLVCGTVSASPRVAGTVSSSPRVSGTVSVEEC